MALDGARSEAAVLARVRLSGESQSERSRRVAVEWWCWNYRKEAAGIYARDSS